MRIDKRLILVAKFLPLTAIVVAIALVLIFMGGGKTHRADAHSPHPGLDFSMGVNTDGNTATGDQRPDGSGHPRGDDCVSFNVNAITATQVAPPKCSVPLNGTFTVRIYLNNLDSVANYQGFDTYLSYAGVTATTFVDTGPLSGYWPACGLPGSFFDFVLQFESFGCSLGLTGTPTTYIGRLAGSDFQCPSSNGFGTITMVHAIGSTDLIEDVGSIHAEGDGTTETLTITCGSPPTLTRTPTPTFTKTLTPTNTLTPTITKTPTITPTPSNTPTVTNTPTATPLPSGQADVTVIKTDSPDPVDSNGTLTYSLQVKNLGLLPATGVLVGDTLPAGIVFVSVSSSDGSFCGYDLGSNAILCSLTNPLSASGQPGDQVKIIIVVTAPSVTVDTRIRNLATVKASSEPFFNTGNNKDSEDTVVLAPRADLTLTKTDRQDPVDSGGTIVYDLTVKNVGPLKATDVLIKENLPDGSTFLPSPDSSPECTVPDGAPIADPDVGFIDVECNLGASFVGETTVHIAITAPKEHRNAVIRNIAYVTGGNELFSQTGNNLAVQNTAVLAPPSDVALDKAGPVKVRRTEKLSYTLTVTNIGLGDADNVSVSDTLPKYILGVISQPMTLQSVNVTGATCGTLVSQKFSCTIVKLPGGSQVVFTVNVRAPTALANVLLTNQASAAAPTNDANLTNNSDSQGTTIQPCFDVTGDGLVRVADILAVVHRFGAHTGDPNYDLLFDFNGDGAITVTDILYVTQHYGVDCL